MGFRAFVVDNQGDRIGTEVTELADEELGNEPVLIDVAWSALNFKDTMVVQPNNRVARRNPLIPGIDLAGTVISSDDPGVVVGSSVLAHGYDLGVAHHGGFAERARIPAEWVVPLPDGVSPRHAVTVGTAGFTAALSLERLRANGVRPDAGPVLVTGASGGVGSMAVSLLAQHGYEVVASTGKEAEHPYLRSLGATTVIGRDEVMGDEGRVLGKERWAAAVDCVGGETLAAVIRSLRYGGSVAASGLTGGNAFGSTVYPFIVRGVALLGVDSVLTPIEERRAVWANVRSDFPQATVAAMVAEEVGLDGIDGALVDMAAARVRGRVLVEPSR
jgi:putative YhdH/YhfP family quinone oxidoreductase